MVAAQQLNGGRVLVKFSQAIAPYAAGEVAAVTKEWADAYVARERAEIVGTPKPRDKRGDCSTTGNIAGRPFGEMEQRAILSENAELKKAIVEQSEALKALTEKVNAIGSKKT